MKASAFPGGLTKAAVFSFDDGVTQDRRLVELMDKYGIRGSFNLNSGLFGTEYVHADYGARISRLGREEARSLYTGHEVASHSVTHPFLDSLDESGIRREMADDKKALEDLFRREVKGFVFPFGPYEPSFQKKAVDIAAGAGFRYVRAGQITGGLDVPRQLPLWRPTAHHKALADGGFLERFLSGEGDGTLRVLSVMGHSYEFEFDADFGWMELEEAFRRISARRDVWFATWAEVADWTMGRG